MDKRMEALSEFLGHKEPVKLGGDMMNLDTNYVLYECLARNYQSIVSNEPAHINTLARSILQRCEGNADKRLAKKMISGDAWALFETVLKRYLLIFVEVRCPPSLGSVSYMFSVCVANIGVRSIMCVCLCYPLGLFYSGKKSASVFQYLHIWSADLLLYQNSLLL